MQLLKSQIETGQVGSDHDLLTLLHSAFTVQIADPDIFPKVTLHLQRQIIDTSPPKRSLKFESKQNSFFAGFQPKSENPNSLRRGLKNAFIPDLHPSLSYPTGASYDQQSAYFKQLVSQDHPLCAFYLQVKSVPRADLTKNISLLQLHDVLVNEMGNRCHSCGLIARHGKNNHNLKRHLKTCGRLKGGSFNKVMLCFEWREFWCQVCGHAEERCDQAVQHLMSHSKTELWQWSINYEYLRVYSEANTGSCKKEENEDDLFVKQALEGNLEQNLEFMNAFMDQLNVKEGTEELRKQAMLAIQTKIEEPGSQNVN